MHSTQKLNNKSSHILEPVLDQYRKANSDHNSDTSDTQHNHTQIPLQNHNNPDQTFTLNDENYNHNELKPILDTNNTNENYIDIHQTELNHNSREK